MNIVMSQSPKLSHKIIRNAQDFFMNPFVGSNKGCSYLIEPTVKGCITQTAQHARLRRVCWLHCVFEIRKWNFCYLLNKLTFYGFTKNKLFQLMFDISQDKFLILTSWWFVILLLYNLANLIMYLHRHA